MVSDVTQRFMLAFGFLQESGKISSAYEFAKLIGISTSMMTEISKGRSNVGITAIQNAVRVFRISAEWLLAGEGEMLKPESPKPESPKPEGNLGQVSDPDSSKIIGELTEVIRTQAKALLEQQQFINAHFSRNSMDSVTPPLTKGGQYADK